MYFLCCLKSPSDYIRQAFIQGGLLFKEIRYICMYVCTYVCVYSLQEKKEEA